MRKNLCNDSNVTLLKHYRKPMKNPIFVELLDHWERLRAGRIAPLRSEIDPRQIENVLEHAFILERQPNAVPRFRIAGMRLNELMGMEIRGMPADSVIAPEGRDGFANTLTRLFDAPEIVELSLASARPQQVSLRAEMLLLPIQSDSGVVSRILGCLVAEGAPASPPIRFTVTAKKVTRIIAANRLRVPDDAMGFAETRAAFTPAPRRPARTGSAGPRDYIRLVKSDE